MFGTDCLENGYLPVNGNVVKKDLSFWEAYVKGTYTFNDQFAINGSVFYSPSVLNSGAQGTYVVGGAKFTAPSAATPEGWTLPVRRSGPLVHRHDRCVLLHPGRRPGCTAPYPTGIPYHGYTTWNVGIGITKSVFTLDLRYYDTDYGKGDCNAFTSDHTARFTGDFTAINPGGFNWCGATFVATGKFDLTAMANLK